MVVSRLHSTRVLQTMSFYFCETYSTLSAARSGNIRNTGNARAPSASASRPGASARQVETPRACMRRKCRAKQTRSVFVQCSWGPPCPEKVHAAREQSKKAYLNGRRPRTACMALKIACGL